MISPVRNADGKFFDSRKADSSMPQDADANGAYNIARKGKIVVDEIRNTQKITKSSLKVKNKDWFEFAQKRFS